MFSCFSSFRIFISRMVVFRTASLSSDSLSEFYKRRIFEEMLEKEEVKKIVHELLFPIT